MCGIIGYIGKKEALPILIDGLKSLEYRGYDSAGVAVLGKSGMVAVRAVGKVANLETKLQQGNHVVREGTSGIAHTRWATHGSVTEENAHPHADCTNTLYVVHNGIIENYKELKRSLEEKGHHFTSQTDTEVLPHLIEEIKRVENTSLEEAVRKAISHVRGTYGMLVVDAKEPGKIVAARNFSPLLLGIGDGELIIASDATAIVKLTKNVVYIHDGELVVITPTHHRVFTLENKTIERTPNYLDWDVVTAQKNGQPHFMLKEILEEPKALKDSLRGRLLLQEGNAKLGGLSAVADRLRGAERIIISGCGTAHYAGKVGEYLLQEYGNMPTTAELASELRYRKSKFGKKDVFLVVSQSGETADMLASLYEAKKQGILTLGIVNVVGSTMSRETDAGVYQHVGPEIGVASTKAFVSQVSILTLLALFLGRARGLSEEEGKKIATHLHDIPRCMERVLEQRAKIEALAKKYRDYKNFFYLGRKYNYPIALEGALKLKEISYVHAEGYAAGEMKHVPFALIDASFPSIVLAPRDSVYDRVISNIQEIKARGGPVIAIGTEGDTELEGLADDVFYIPKTLEMLTPLLTVLPLQLFAYYFGTHHGIDVDTPRNLAKSVTVE